MEKMTVKELVQTEGGINITGTLMNSVTSMIRLLFDVGRSLGSAIRRMENDAMCPIVTNIK